MKYIDADRLLVEIDKLCDEAPSYDDSRTYLMEVSSLIESLQQDESQVDKMLCSQIWWQEQGWTMIPPETTIEGIDSLLKAVRRKLQQKCPPVLAEFMEKASEIGEKYNYGFGPNLQQPKVDLEKAIKEQIYDLFFDLDGIAIIGTSGYATVEDMVYIARYFYELGFNARKK